MEYIKKVGKVREGDIYRHSESCGCKIFFLNVFFFKLQKYIESIWIKRVAQRVTV